MFEHLEASRDHGGDAAHDEQKGLGWPEQRSLVLEG